MSEYVMVPNVPTTDMMMAGSAITAAFDSWGKVGNADEIYTAMLAASPAPTTGREELFAHLKVLSTCDDMEVSHGEGDTNVGDVARQCLAALAHPPAGEGWRPIESAPRDGTHILLFAPACDYRGQQMPARLTYGYWLVLERGKYLGDCGGECRCPEYDDAPDPSWFSEDGGFTVEHPPTHWQPLPAPPAEEGER